MFLSGDWVPLGLPDRIRRQAPEAAVVSLGGATEASIWSILYPMADQVDPSVAERSLTASLWTTRRFTFLNSPVSSQRPVWVPGDLYIGGVGLARGYWRDEERSAAAFIENREGEELERLYRTGDLGRYLPDGTIEFLGRDDTQVKIQGYRVELGEIEAALGSHPVVGAAAVLAPERPDSDPTAHRRRLVAYIARSSGTSEPGTGVGWNEADGESVDRLAGLDVEPLTNPKERHAFRRRRPSQRRDLEQRQALALPIPDGNPQQRAERFLRSSHRQFLPGAVSLNAFGRFLGHLQQIQPSGLPLPKYRYPSGGGLYPVQLYLHLREGGVEGMAAGSTTTTPSATSWRGSLNERSVSRCTHQRIGRW